MKRILTGKMLSLAVAMVALVALGAMATNATGAYFGDAKAGTETGSVGSVMVDTAATNGGGSNSLDLAFVNLMPGVPQTLATKFTNTGTANQDVWVVFSDVNALRAINDLGTYGAIKVESEEGTLFYSANLNDRPNNGTTPLPVMIRLRQNMPRGASGTMLFTFQYASKIGDPSSSHGRLNGGGVWNTYPVPLRSWETAPPVATSGTGLPYQIVATQVGIAPDAVGSSAGF